MKLGHVIYAVKDLDKAVKEWTQRGFTVEYGKLCKSHNAYIYFCEGPYIELVEGGGMTKFQRKLLALFYGKAFAQRFNELAELPEGWACLCIEKESGNLEGEVDYLRSIGIDGKYIKKGSRTDSKNRCLKYKCYYTYDYNMPFLMTYFEGADPKPIDYMHPNGIRSISKVKFHTTKKYANTLRGLVRDERLELTETFNTGIENVEFKR